MPSMCLCPLYHNWYDAQHRYRMRLPHHPNSTHDTEGNDVVQQDMYWDDDSDRCYEEYMDNWCDMVYPAGGLSAPSPPPPETFAKPLATLPVTPPMTPIEAWVPAIP